MSSSDRVFIASSSESRKYAEIIQELLLDQHLDTRGWWDGESFRPSEVTIESLERSLETCNAGFFLVAEDDDRVRRGISEPTPRDNVILELGLFAGLHGRHRCAIGMLGSPSLPTDLSALTYIRLDEAESPDDFKRKNRGKIRDWATTLKRMPPKFTKGIPTPGPPSPSAIASDSDPRGKYSLAGAFPMIGRTRLAYTCRSSFEKPPFRCPSLDSDTGPLTLGSHIPVDELETFGMCLSQFGRPILGEREESVRDAAFCSQVGANYAGNDHGSIGNDNEISPLLMDNIILIGENTLSNRLFHLCGHSLPWHHLFVEVAQMPHGNRSLEARDFRVKARFSRAPQHGIDESVWGEIVSDAVAVGMVTYSANPFAPDKRVLCLLGCNRAGQYLLLSWLKSAEAEATFKSVIEHRGENNYLAIQVVVIGKCKVDGRLVGSPPHGSVVSDWTTCRAVTDKKNGLPFFGVKTSCPLEKCSAGDAICDISLVATVDSHSEPLATIVKSLPRGLARAVQRASAPRVGSHVTLFEFMCEPGHRHHDFAKGIVSPKGSAFLRSLATHFSEVGRLRFRLRQARATRYSVQVLADVDVNLDPSLLMKLSASDRMANVPGLIAQFCEDAATKLNGFDQLNVMACPSPLHLTIARFETPLEENSEHARLVRKWVEQHNRTIWGTMEEKELLLTHADHVPFKVVGTIPVRAND